ncbi:MAG TPA: hypothetical protein DEG06_07005 [Lachnospiraceae bacterium]|nr:hypothetical protein [Lachnospiraceae bacterium]
MLSLCNDLWEVQFDKDNGAIRKIIDLVNKKTILDNLHNEVFRLECEEEKYMDSFHSFMYVEKEDGVKFQWNITSDITLIALWQMDGNSISVESYIENRSNQKLSSMEYPLLDGIGDFAAIYGGKNRKDFKNYVAHSYATGFLIEEPLDNFHEDEGFRYMPYPESFSGASMQFFTYYCENKVGLYFAAYDGQYHQKWLNFYKHNGKLRASQIYGYEDIGYGNGLKAPWKFVITLTSGDGWYEGCDLYKKWALQQTWCSGGKLKERGEDKKASWLCEEMGACTFGIDACHDRSLWLERYSEDIKSPIFHVLGPDWTKVEQNYKNSIPGGYNDWFPTRFLDKNLDVIRRHGDRFAPFEFDFLVATDKSDSDMICNSLQKWPQKPKSRDEYKFTMLCPICQYTQDLHVKRDVQVMRESGCDAMYYDISANNILKTCMSDRHGHPVGAGKIMTEAYRKIYFDTKQKLAEVKGQYVPLGTEMMNEVFLDCLDFYQARANAQPCSFLETGIFRDLIKQGKAQVIPMFQYVYSGYAPLRMDGWGKLTKEGGDLIYHTIAKTYLWGGLFEINSEYSAMEMVDEIENSAEEHYCDFDPVGFPYDKSIADYIAKFAALRTGRYNHYLAYGEMKRPPKLHIPKVWRTYYQYNSAKSSMEWGDRGKILLDSVVTARYGYEDSELILFANTTDLTQDIMWQDDILQEDREYDVCFDYSTKTSDTKKIIGKELRNLKLSPRQLFIVENKK